MFKFLPKEWSITIYLNTVYSVILNLPFKLNAQYIINGDYLTEHQKKILIMRLMGKTQNEIAVQRPKPQNQIAVQRPKPEKNEKDIEAASL